MVSLKQKKQSGFTIVELLIVIVIIGILAGLVVTQILGATAKARDTERKTDLDQISNQLEAYYAQKGSYPALAELNTSGWRGGNEFSAGDGTKSFADPSSPSTTSLSATPPAAIGNSYSYAPLSESNGNCATTTTNTGTTINPVPTNPCTKYTLTAYLETTKATYTKTNANN